MVQEQLASLRLGTLQGEVVLPVANGATTPGARDPAQGPELGTKRGNHIGRVVRILGHDEMVPGLGCLLRRRMSHRQNGPWAARASGLIDVSPNGSTSQDA